MPFSFSQPHTPHLLVDRLTALQRGNTGILPQKRRKKGRERKRNPSRRGRDCFFFFQLIYKKNKMPDQLKTRGAPALNEIISPSHAEPDFKGPNGVGSNGKSILWLANQRRGRCSVDVSPPSGGRGAVTFRKPSHFLRCQSDALTELRSPPRPVSVQF